MRIGVNVGGTNTDAVMMDDCRLVASHKAATSENVSDGVVAAIRAVFSASGVDANGVNSVMIGTTQFTNAFVERRGLLEVAVFRVARPAAQSLPPMVDWPADLATTIGGGHHCDGRVNTPFDEGAVRDAALDMKRKGIRAAAVLGLFPPVNVGGAQTIEQGGHRVALAAPACNGHGQFRGPPKGFRARRSA